MFLHCYPRQGHVPSLLHALNRQKCLRACSMLTLAFSLRGPPLHLDLPYPCYTQHPCGLFSLSSLRASQDTLLPRFVYADVGNRCAWRSFYFSLFCPHFFFATLLAQVIEVRWCGQICVVPATGKVAIHDAYARSRRVKRHRRAVNVVRRPKMHVHERRCGVRNGGN